MATNEHKKETQERSNEEDIKEPRQEWGGWQKANLEKHLNADVKVVDEPGAQQTKDEIINELRTKLQEANYTIDHLLNNQQKLEKEIKDLKNIIEQLRDLHLQCLQCTGKLCAHNCVLCTILWTCQWKLGFYPCGLQLLILLYHEVAAEIKSEHRICYKLIMEIFSKCNIVEVDAEYTYPLEEHAKVEVIMQAWERIMTMDYSKRVLILGRIAEDGVVGHAEVCDLESRTSNTVHGTLKIYNPQRDEHPIRENFYDHVKNDKGLIIYRVLLENLSQKCTENPSIKHYTNPHLSTSCVAMEQ